jgi:hypothetical protein
MKISQYAIGPDVTLNVNVQFIPAGLYRSVEVIYDNSRKADEAEPSTVLPALTVADRVISPPAATVLS